MRSWQNRAQTRVTDRSDDNGAQASFWPLGVDGVLIRFGATFTPAAQAAVTHAAAAIAQAQLAGVGELTPSLVSLRVAFDPAQVDRASLIAALRALLDQPQTPRAARYRHWQIPVGFGPDNAPDLPQVAASLGLSCAQAAAQITAAPLRVLAIGFAPGQPYLGLLPPAWDMPRQDHLTPQMPAGALVTALRQVIIFAASTPTGWRQIGQSGFAVYDAGRDPPFAFAPNDTVQFVAASDGQISALRADPASNGGARWEWAQ